MFLHPLLYIVKLQLNLYALLVYDYRDIRTYALAIT